MKCTDRRVSHLLLLILLAASASKAASSLVGVWTPVQNLTDPQIQGVAKFAVAEHNKQAGDRFAYLRVLGGETQVVAGTNYRLLIRAKTGHGRFTYEAVVWDKPWERFRQLTSFKLKA